MTKVAFPVSERDGTVTVECANAVSAQDLEMMQETFLERLREAVGEQAPQALRFRVNSERF
jgi:predicted nucleic acid-binding Zn ribbon protein